MNGKGCPLHSYWHLLGGAGRSMFVGFLLPSTLCSGNWNQKSPWSWQYLLIFGRWRGKNTEILMTRSNTSLSGGINPCETYDPQNGNLPQVGVKIKHIWNHHLVVVIREYSRLTLSCTWDNSGFTGYKCNNRPYVTASSLCTFTFVLSLQVPKISCAKMTIPKQNLAVNLCFGSAIRAAQSWISNGVKDWFQLLTVGFKYSKLTYYQR